MVPDRQALESGFCPAHGKVVSFSGKKLSKFVSKVPCKVSPFLL